LIATTQSELGVPIRIRRTLHQETLALAETESQLSALQKVNARFYAIVLKRIDETLPRGGKNRGIEANKLSNFARSTFSVVRGWIRAGGDIRTLAARTTTKSTLVIEARPKLESAQKLEKRAQRQAEAAIEAIAHLADKDKGAAINRLQLFQDEITLQLQLLGSKPKLYMRNLPAIEHRMAS
jgi:hypothetical protein